MANTSTVCLYRPIVDAVSTLKLTDNQKNRAYWFIDNLLDQQFLPECQIDQFVSLKSKTLEDNMGSKYYSGIIQPLLENGIIEEDPSYCKGKYSKGYRANPCYLT